MRITIGPIPFDLWISDRKLKYEADIMKWNDTKAEIISACGEALYPLGYKYVKSQESFEQTKGNDKRMIFLGFVAKKDTLHEMLMWCGIRNADIETVFHRTPGVSPQYRRNYTVANIAMTEYLDLETRHTIETTKEETRRFLSDVALPFLSREYTFHDYSQMLNTNPSDRCLFHANSENRCHYGLICARLSGDPHYEDIKEAYSAFLHSTNNGFYYPRFMDLVADLETVNT